MSSARTVPLSVQGRHAFDEASTDATEAPLRGLAIDTVQVDIGRRT